MSSQDDELASASQQGDADAVLRLTRQGLLKPEGQRAQRAVVLAAAANRVAALEVLLDWGAPADAADEGRPALHAACKAAETTALLLRKGARPGLLDAEGRTALDRALAVGCLEPARELVRAGAEVSPEQLRTVPGLSAIVRDCHLERQAAKLKADSREARDSDGELAALEGRVWEAQREHMRLLRLREERRAGGRLFELEAEAAEAKRARATSAHAEAQLATELADRRVELQKSQARVMELIRDTDAHREAWQQSRTQKAALDTELSQRRAELETTQADRAAAEASLAAKTEARAEATARVASAAERLGTARARAEELRARLKAQRAELRGWRRDKALAAELTAQAHKRLGAHDVS